jgi:hypothetical protein
VSSSLTDSERSRRWREVFIVYGAVTALTFAVGWLDVLWSPLAGLSGLIVALAFMWVPTELLHRRGESPLRSGIGGRADGVDEHLRERLLRLTRQAVLVALCILPLYALGTSL